jgi:uncharacterized membrane protein affecting hemolysin expression
MQTRSQTRVSNQPIQHSKSMYNFLKISIDKHKSRVTVVSVKQTMDILSNEETNELHELIDDWKNWHSKIV